MLEFVLVEHGDVYPNACVVCGSLKGPILDTHVEKWGEHLYLCRGCIGRSARVYGLVKGPRHDELVAAAETLDQKDVELQALTRENEELRLANGSHRRKLAELREQLQASSSQATTMAHIATELERLSRQIVETAGQVPVEQMEAVA